MSIDGGLQVGDRAEDAAADALPGHLGEEGLDGVEPGGRGRGEMEGPAWMARQPGQHFGMFVGGVVVEDNVDRLVSQSLAFDGVEKTDEFEVAVTLHAAADHRAVEHAECGEEGGGAVSLVVVCHGLAPAGLYRQPGLRAVERLDLTLFIERQHHRVSRRIEVEPNDVDELGGKAGVARAFEGAQPVRLQLVRPPDALHRAKEPLQKL